MERLDMKRSVVPKTAECTQKRKRILLGQLVSNGDCLYATAISRQIKTDYPGCHLTWAISSVCRSILNGNPHVDEVWELPISNSEEVVPVWDQFEREAHERKKRGDFDEIFLTQVAPGNLHNYDGSIRSSLFRGYPKPITVPVSPVLRLSPIEVANVNNFAAYHRLAEKAHVILFECSPKSGQSFVTPDYALEVAQHLVEEIPEICIILSSNISIHSTDVRVVDGSALSFRENAELTKHCSLLIGCSSGISWISTSDWAKPLPMIQLLASNPFWSNSFIHDHEQWGLPTDRIIEMTDCLPNKLSKCVVAILNEGFDSAKCAFHQQIPHTFNTWRNIQCQLLQQREYRKAAHLLLNNIQRHGFHYQLILGYLVTWLQYPCLVALRKTAGIRRRLAKFLDYPGSG